MRDLWTFETKLRGSQPPGGAETLLTGTLIRIARGGTGLRDMVPSAPGIRLCCLRLGVPCSDMSLATQAEACLLVNSLEFATLT